MKVESPKATRDGSVSLGFSQKVSVPDFAKKKTQRRLQASDGVDLGNIDVTRDILDVKFILKSDVNIEDLEYFLNIKSWTPDNFDVGIEFANPLIVSQGE